MHVVSIDQFDPESLKKLFARADEMKSALESKNLRVELARKHNAKQICSLFYEPSTRTRLSFEAAAMKLGMDVVSTENAGQFSSAAKGETLEDTFNILNGHHYTAVVMRHNETGAAERAAKISKAPIINAGDGKGEHPTQALLDAYTIHRQVGRLDDLRVVMGGDLKYGRTVRSLARLLSLFPNNHITFVSIPQLQMEQDIKDLLDKAGTTYDETADLAKAFKDANVVYWTRLQKERLENPGSIETGGFNLNKQNISYLPKEAIIMHPLPRVDEISVEVDNDPRAKYFEQAENGLYIRMALLDQIASDD